MSYIGDFRLGETFDTKFTTRQISGAPSTLGSSPVISAYVGNSTTQITAGITLSVDFDAVTGLNNVRVVATSGNGYATASNYQLVITTGTVNSVSVVGEVIAEFSIENRSALMPTTAARTLDVSAGGEAGVDWANVGSPTTTVGLSGTTVKTATDVETDTADIQTRIPAALVGGRIDANVGAISSDATAADNAEAFFDGTGYAGTNNVIPTVTTATNVTTVNGLAANVITATSINTGAITAAKFAAGAIDAAAIATGAIDADAVAADAATEIANAVWDTDATGRQTQGTFGQAIGDPAADTNSIFKAVVTDATGATVGVDVVDLKTQIGTAGAGLTAIDLPDQTMNITGNLSGSVGSVTGAVGSVTGAVGSVTGAVGSVAGNVDGNVTGTVAGVTPATAAQVAALLTTQITEAYRANGAAPTLAQFMSEVLAHLGEASISGTTKTINKLDHVTAAATYTLDDASTPAAITRAT